MSYATPEATGRSLRPGMHVRIISKDHQFSGRTGMILGFERNRVWVRLMGGAVVAASRRSIGFVPGSRA